MRHIVAMFFLLCPLLAGCGSYFPPDRNVQETLSDLDVIGRWRMTPESLGLLTRDGFRTKPAQACTVTFNDDGTCEYQTADDFTDKGRYVSASGVWKLEHDASGISNRIAKNAIWTQLTVDGGHEIHHFQLTREEGSLLLWQPYRDPDQWEFLEYRRAP